MKAVQASQVFQPGPESVPRARHWLVDQLMIHGVDARAADAALCVSELVANVVTHTKSDIEIDVRSEQGRAIHVAVSDHSDDLPRAVGAQPGQPAGRGLVVVHALAKEWGVTPHAHGGKTVWFDLD